MDSNGAGAEIRHLGVKRTARYAVIGELSSATTDVWIACHGYAQLAPRFVERFRPIAAPERVIVAPEGLSRFYTERGGGFHGPSSQVGASWMTSEDRESDIADNITYLQAMHDEIFRTVPRERAKLTVLGFSQGTAAVARWVAASESTVDRVILWAGSLPAELTSLGARRLTAAGRPLLLVAGEDDQFITSKILDAQLATLSGLGVTTSVMRYPGGHELDAAILQSIVNS